MTARSRWAIQGTVGLGAREGAGGSSAGALGGGEAGGGGTAVAGRCSKATGRGRRGASREERLAHASRVSAQAAMPAPASHRRRRPGPGTVVGTVVGAEASCGGGGAMEAGSLTGACTALGLAGVCGALTNGGSGG